MLRHSKPDASAIYTHGNLGKAFDAQRVYGDQLREMKPASESTTNFIGSHRAEV
jgi:hypothetical protein